VLVNRLLPGMMLTVTLWAATGGDASCSGVLKTPDGVPVPRVLVELREVAGARKWDHPEMCRALSPTSAALAEALILSSPSGTNQRSR
jgi:hypothetical protein